VYIWSLVQSDFPSKLYAGCSLPCVAMMLVDCFSSPPWVSIS
jgi:hypothetical protein